MPSLNIRHRNQDRSQAKSPVTQQQQQQQNPAFLPVSSSRPQRPIKASSSCCRSQSSCRCFLLVLVMIMILGAATFWNLSFLSNDSLQLHNGFESSQMDLAAAVAFQNMHPVASKQNANAKPGVTSRNGDSMKNSKTIDHSDEQQLPPKRLPKHQACHGYDGIYHIAMSDELGGVGTAFFQLVIGQILYAQAHNLKPWIHFNNFSRVFYDADIHDAGTPGVHFKAMGGRNVTALHLHGQRRPLQSSSSSSAGTSASYYRYWRKDQTPGPPDPLQPIQQQEYHFPGTGVWEHYMEPISDFVPGDVSCESKLYVTIQDVYLITPGIHGYADDYATACWRYDYLPAYKTQPHIPLSEWLEPQRRRANDVIQQFHIQPRPFIIQAALQANPNCGFQTEDSGSGSSSSGRRPFLCLGLHVRHSDKAAGRRQIAVTEFLPFARAFVQSGGQQIYLATDSAAVLDEIESTWPSDLRRRIRTLGHDIVRSRNGTAVFDMVAARHHRTNIEALTEIWALSQCQYLIHGLSAVSEASIWINLDLHDRSVNLEDDENHRLTSAEFGTLVAQDQMLRSDYGDEQSSVPSLYRPKATRTFSWWDQLKTPAATMSAVKSDTACASGHRAAGYDGILHISAVAAGAGVGHAFFTSVLNQLLYAEKYNLKPYIHLQPLLSPLVYDDAVHNRSDWTLRVFNGRVEDKDNSVAGDSPPGKPIMTTTNSSNIILSGNGIWESYFEPVSDFAPMHQGSCKTDPPLIVTLNQRQVTSGLESFSPWAVRAWRYDTVPESIWNPQAAIQDALPQMRQKAHEIVKKYFRFRPAIVEQANEANPMDEDDPPCLAVHIRAAAKDGKYRKVITAGSYLPYMQAFVQAGGKVIYVASDSSRALRYMENDGNFPASVTGIIRTQGMLVARSPVKDLPTHLMDDHHRVNSETLVDILAMSKCQLLVHSYSAVAEAAIYLNPNLHGNSVNLEDSGKVSPEEFEHISRKVMLESQRQVEPNLVPSDTTKGDDGILQYPLANTTVLSRSKDHTCRSNAIVYLAQKRHSTYGRDSYSSLLQSLDLLHANYLSIDNHINNMNIFIFHTNEFNETDIDIFESRLGASYRHKIHLVDLTGSRFWGRPQNLAQSNPESWYAYPLFSEGYRHMMRFFAMEIWNFFAEWNNATGCAYRYIFRMDEDSFLHSPIRYDIFDFMRSNEYVYGYRMCTYEMAVAKRMWTRWQQQRIDWKPKRELDDDNLARACGFYNNFFVADLEFFLGDEVQAFLNFIARRGHIYKWRLGDLVIHSMVVYGYAETKQVHRFLDFTYEHGTMNQTSGCLVWGGIQAGYNDPKARETLDEYYTNMIVDKNCSANATFLQQHDLSPSYIHHLPFSLEGGRLALHTIAAGGVELSGKGILSG